MADYATGGVIPPGSWLTFAEDGCTLHIPPRAATTNATFTYSAGGLEQAFADWLRKAVRTGQIRPDDGSAGVLAKV